jgi:KUP system potassium uptake protein
MKSSNQKEKVLGGSHLNALSLTGLIITLGIVYGDIGTSPLYVMKALGKELSIIDKASIYGGVSCIFWTLTLQTTLKYIIITLRADNKGEGGIFALFAIIRRKYRWAYVIALIGGSTLLADGIITPAITVTSAVEGLEIFNPQIPVVLIVIGIISLIFFSQQFGTNVLGKSFGPIMVIWFSTLGFLGLHQIIHYPEILKAINPLYAILLLTSHPGGIIILGAVFLATTGAEALYSDLGHCGVKNIRVSWIFVKSALLLNYFGQASWIIANPNFLKSDVNPFFAIMPQWFLLPGIVLATMAAIIASQALISGSFTLISEAISLNFWPKMNIKYPTEIKGQMYVPNINLFLWIGCIGVVLLFRTSSAMDAAYGLSITITMLMTTMLLLLYLRRKVPFLLLVVFGMIYATIEGIFLYANLAKFIHGGWFTIMAAGVLALIMYTWYNGRRIKNSFMVFVPIKYLIEVLTKVRVDTTIPKFATNLVYISKANELNQIESTIVYSLLDKLPKSADTYWFIHIDIKDEPFTFNYEVTHLVKGVVIRIDFHLGFKVEPRINLFFKQVMEDLNKTGEIKIESRYPSLKDFSTSGDCRYIIIDRILTADHKFSIGERLIMNISDLVSGLAITDYNSLHLDASNILVEKVPLGTPDSLPNRLTRIKYGN